MNLATYKAKTAAARARATQRLRPEELQPHAIETAVAAIYSRFLRGYRAELMARFVQVVGVVRRDAPIYGTGDFIKLRNVDPASTQPELEKAARRLISHAAGVQAKLLGVSKKTALESIDHDEFVAAFVKRNVDRIAVVQARMQERAEKALSKSDDPARARDLFDKSLKASEAGATSSARMEVIASVGELHRKIQTSLGITKYLWRSQRDRLVRPAHKALDNGKAYKWTNPPLKARVADNHKDDHPGEDYNCRCMAEPIVDEDKK